MSGIFWLIGTWGAIAVSLAVSIWRILSIMRLPRHLRWELAPIPGERSRGSYGGSYLEEYEWWTKKRQKSHGASVIYMAKEIFFMHGIWRNNKGLWPFSFFLHWGIYLLVIALIFQVVFAIIFQIGFTISEPLLRTISILSLIAFLTGTAATVSFMIKRSFDRNLAWSNTIGTFLHLAILCAVFVSGGAAWLFVDEWEHHVIGFIGGILTFDQAMTVPLPLAVSTGFTLLFCLYLPFTNMLHMVTKYFLYHHIRWDERPQSAFKEIEFQKLLAQPIGWRRIRNGSGSQKTWSEVAKED
jgi:nitrate reductase gamma subunit